MIETSALKEVEAAKQNEMIRQMIAAADPYCRAAASLLAKSIPSIILLDGPEPREMKVVYPLEVQSALDALHSLAETARRRVAEMSVEYGKIVSLETKCRRCGTNYGDRAFILFSYCLNCNALMCCVSPENSAKGICGHCQSEADEPAVVESSNGAK